MKTVYVVVTERRAGQVIGDNIVAVYSRYEDARQHAKVVARDGGVRASWRADILWDGLDWPFARILRATVDGAWGWGVRLC